MYINFLIFGIDIAVMITSFEWDDRKNRENIKKHGISFNDA
jgi:hypothetical protein